MAERQTGASLTREHKQSRIAVARRNLGVFLSSLDPLLRKYVLEPRSLTVAEY